VNNFNENKIYLKIYFYKKQKEAVAKTATTPIE